MRGASKRGEAMTLDRFPPDDEIRSLIKMVRERWAIGASHLLADIAEDWMRMRAEQRTALALRCVNCGDHVNDHAADDEERRECKLCLARLQALWRLRAALREVSACDDGRECECVRALKGRP
jgi:hypothetical protein